MPPPEENASGDSLRILALEPWLGGSHELFLEQWREESAHELEIVGLPARHWRWRMHSAPWQLAERLSGQTPPDVLFVSDYVDLPSLLGQLPAGWTGLPVVAYFHENQATYPLSGPSTEQARERDHTFPWLNAMTAVRADRVLFNSEFHRGEFARAMEELFRIWPKPNPRQAFRKAMESAEIVSPGVRVSRMPLGPGAPSGAPLRLLFNQRWEHDKDPVGMLDALIRVGEAGGDFRLNLLGERFAELPAGAAERLARLEDRVLVNGFASSRADYEATLGESDLVLSTSRHEFFGIAVVEALAAGCTPVLPTRLAYPEVIPEALHATALYADDDSLHASLMRHCGAPESLRPRSNRERWRAVAAKHDVSLVAQRLDEACRRALDSRD